MSARAEDGGGLPPSRRSQCENKNNSWIIFNDGSLFLWSRVCVKMTETEQTSSKKAGGEKCVFISKLAHIIPQPHIVVARAISLNKQ